MPYLKYIIILQLSVDNLDFSSLEEGETIHDWLQKFAVMLQMQFRDAVVFDLDLIFKATSVQDLNARIDFLKDFYKILVTMIPHIKVLHVQSILFVHLLLNHPCVFTHLLTHTPNHPDTTNVLFLSHRHTRTHHQCI